MPAAQRKDDLGDDTDNVTRFPGPAADHDPMMNEPDPLLGDGEDDPGPGHDDPPPRPMRRVGKFLGGERRPGQVRITDIHPRDLLLIGGFLVLVIIL